MKNNPKNKNGVGFPNESYIKNFPDSSYLGDINYQNDIEKIDSVMREDKKRIGRMPKNKI